jgi:hypothetical protein
LVAVLTASRRTFVWLQVLSFSSSTVGAAVYSLLSLLLFGTIACYTAAVSRKVRPAAIGICLPVLFGCLYMTLPWLLYLRYVGPPTYLFWSWAVLAPVASALITLRSARFHAMVTRK